MGSGSACATRGAVAVVEGVGDHGCEYMTGGRVVVLGAIGRNFGAGMSGGTAYVHDPDRTFDGLVNHEMVDVEPLDDEDLRVARGMRHEVLRADQVRAGRALLDEWAATVEDFVKVMPREYRQVLEAVARAREEGAIRGRRRDGAPMGKPTGFLELGRACRAVVPCPCGCATGTRSTSRHPSRRRGSRQAAAWTAGSRSATRAARSGT